MQRSKEYEEYIKSEAWGIKCEERKIIAKRRCEMCGKKEEDTKALQIHHITYKNLGNEDVLNDLICLCGRCHILIHKYYNRTREVI